MGILQKNIAYKLATTLSVLQACVRLHNFIIEQQLLHKAQDTEKTTADDDDDDHNDLHIVSHAAAPSSMRYLPILPQDDYEAMAENSLPQQAVLETD